MLFSQTLNRTSAAATWPGERRSRRQRIAKWLTVSFFALFTMLLLAIGAFTFYGIRYSNQVYAGTTLADVDVSGMTRPEVETAMNERFADFASQPVVFTDGVTTYEIPVTTLGLTLDLEATVDRAMNLGREGNYWDRSIVWTNGVLDGRALQPVIDVDEAAFRSAMEDIAPAVTSLPSNAYIDLSQPGSAVLVPDQSGRSLSVSQTRERTLRALGALEQEPVPLAVITMPAEVVSADVEGGLSGAERAVADALKVHTDEGSWGLSRTMLTGLVTVDDNGQLVVDEPGVQAFVLGVAEQIDHEAVDAGIGVDENGALVVVPQVNSATVDVDSTTTAVIEAIREGSRDIPMVVERSEPAILDAAAQEWVDRAEVLLGDGLELKWPGGSSQLGRADLLAALVITPQPDAAEQFALTWDETVLGERLDPLAEDLYVPVKEVQFRLVDGEIRYISEPRDGRELDVDGTVAAILTAVEDGKDNSQLVLTTTKAQYSASDRSTISLPDVLGQSQTYYGNSSDPRRQNVNRATELEDGWLIPPDGVFSYAEVMGLVDEANGFVTGFGIVADPSGGVTTAPVIGGGICQVSTTIFQAAFWAGLTIEERWSHPYWLLGYGQEPYGMQGLDAMVNIEPDWALDLKFRNTTGNWIALVMVADGENVHAEIRGTDPGWTIEVPPAVITEVVAPESGMIYTDSSELPKGQELQVEHAREGFTSTITRTVIDRDGNVVDEYVLESTYSASRDTTLRGTGGS